ncbi:XH/XS domain-containing protein [Actinidia rufa]|uniref:XH/XS domain-containing protein n=1 Tax=Actinidia rufa TaxID=165716 RepID=A0A7J0GR24_9ERIC|nr:XH/XS domain-containing protein [Actinidia rufa]
MKLSDAKPSENEDEYWGWGWVTDDHGNDSGWGLKLWKISDGSEEEIIDKNDENLKTPKAEYGNEVYEAVTTALTEINCYNPSGRLLVTELWNFKEKRKATLKEGVSHLLEQLKVYKRKSNSQ